MQVSIAHPNLDTQETMLSSDVAATATTSTVDNTKTFANEDYVVFGLPGEELTEIVALSGVSGNTVLNHATGPVFAHSARTQVAQIKFNQARVYSASSEDGSYTILATIDLTLDQDYTFYEDTAGSKATWYKIRYYNSAKATQSSLSVAVKGTGYTDDSLKSMGDEVLEDFGDIESKDLTRVQVDNYLRAGVRKIVSEIIKFYPDYRRNYLTKALSSGVVALPDRFLGFIRIDAGTTADTSYKCTYSSEGELTPGTTYSSHQPRAFIRGSNLRILPNDITNVYMWYWDYPVSMITESSEHGLPYGARDVLVIYALWRGWLGKDDDKAAAYKSVFRQDTKDYLEFAAQSRQIITSGHVDITSGEDMYDFS